MAKKLSAWKRCGDDEQCRERLRAARRRSYYRNRDAQIRAVRDWQFRARYGITLDRYEAMVREQNNQCAICEIVPTGRRLAVDHDHTTGVVRGLLCANCNRGIGNFRDNADLLALAALYVLKR